MRSQIYSQKLGFLSQVPRALFFFFFMPSCLIKNCRPGAGSVAQLYSACLACKGPEFNHQHHKKSGSQAGDDDTHLIPTHSRLS
jgi:hypothetical protein